MTIYADLIDAKTAETLRTELLDRLEQEGFPITAWQAGNAARTLVAVDVQTLAELYALVAQIGKGWSLDDAEGAWLTLHAWSRYRVARTLATFARHVVRLTVASGAGPYTITPGQLVLSRGSLRYRSTNSANVALAYGSPVDVTVQCESSGVAGNAQPTAVVTPALAGVTMAWQSLDLSARDEETDPELRQRCRDKWATLSVQGCGTRAAYRFHILAATLDGTPIDEGGTSCGVTRIGFLSPPGDGTVPIRIAGASGLLDDTARDAVRAWIEDDRRPHTDTPSIQHAGTVTVDFTGSTVRFRAGQNIPENRNAAQTAVRNCINGYAMGDDTEEPVVDQEAVSAAIYAALPGKIADIDLACGDVTIPAGSIAVGDETLITFS